MRTSILKKIRAVDTAKNTYLEDVLHGLGRKQKSLPSKYFYDDAGVKLFDEICRLDEYYLYHTELRMLPQISQELSQMISGELDVIEFGAGSLIKIRLLLEHLNGVRHYMPIDIAGNYLRKATSQLRDELNDIKVTPIEADFTNTIKLPDCDDDITRMGFFPGSTIGNFSPTQSAFLLEKFRKSLGGNSWLLVGVDTKKSPSILHRAYNDGAGITAMFNKNLLLRINRELDGTFDIDQFAHYAFYNIQEGRIEMHLVSLTDQKVSVSGVRFSFQRGESIHTENSYKYSPEEFSKLAEFAGWRIKRQWQDENQLFSHHLLYAGL
ncbi:MAG: L-histidine N(alpha)-methyltransferase [Gammaproteobacteria bacterium]|nr:L-histidine N(alpha)-methyltransferase [Gammaproteobacteria bacterium]